MRCRRFWLMFLTILPPLLHAEDGSWEERMARQFSGRLGDVEKELGEIAAELPALPGVTDVDQGGTGGFSCQHIIAEPTKGEEFSVSLGFAEPGEIDLVVLVPARRYGAAGMDPQFGLPDAFTVDLYDQTGKVVARIAEPRQVWADPVRRGHPFVFPVQPPVRAAGMKISALRLRLDSDIPQTPMYAHAWAEAFAFSGERNLARGGSVKISGGSPPTALWQWSIGYLIDGQTPLGLPEIPAGDHRMSAGCRTRDSGSRMPYGSNWTSAKPGSSMPCGCFRPAGRFPTCPVALAFPSASA